MLLQHRYFLSIEIKKQQYDFKLITCNIDKHLEVLISVYYYAIVSQFTLFNFRHRAAEQIQFLELTITCSLTDFYPARGLFGIQFGAPCK